MHQIRTTRTNDFFGVLRGDSEHLLRCPLKGGQILSVFIATNTSVDHGDIEERGLVQRRPSSHQFLELCCDDVGRRLHHARHLLAHPKHPVGVVDPVGRFLGTGEGFVEDFILQQDRT